LARFLSCRERENLQFKKRAKRRGVQGFVIAVKGCGLRG
jgi:hypothetical protein